METNTNNKNIQLESKNGIWHRKTCHANNENGKSQVMEGIKLSNQEIIRTLEEEEITSTWEYWKRTTSNL